MDNFCSICGSKLCKENKSGLCRKCINKSKEARKKNSEGLKKAYLEGRRKDPKEIYKSLSNEKKERMNWGKNKLTIKEDKVFKENSFCKKETIKKYFLNKKEYKCEKCGIEHWNNEYIPLEIHHKDGNRKNNTIDNLELLCPNCHSQTETFRGRNTNKGVKIVSDEELLESLKSSDSINNALLKVGLSGSGNYKRVYKLLKNVDISFFNSWHRSPEAGDK